MSYTGAFASFCASITLEKVGVMVGIATALVTCGVNWYFKWRRAKSDEAVAAARIREAQAHTGEEYGV
ncbi:phage holin [Burkholderia sp. USMB20]|uniref:phage holin n=1 Tax=Burkholderia sp. USMB20 TaxID=1571773 RepID=UPI001A9C2374|nr:phage holin [Burkholderia sp. USMB20]